MNRINPLPPDSLSEELLYIHQEISALINRSQSPVRMIDNQGALLGPFIPMLHFPQFGIAALTFLRTLDTQATLDKKVREVAILTVGAFYGAKFELYVHEIMAAAFGIKQDVIAALACGSKPEGLTRQEAMAHEIAKCLVCGHILPTSTYNHALTVFGKEALAELFFLIGGYSLIAMLLNAYDMPAGENGK